MPPSVCSVRIHLRHTPPVEVKGPCKTNRSENNANSATRACYRTENNFDGTEKRSDSNRIVSGRIENDFVTVPALRGKSENYASTATTSGDGCETDTDRSESDVDTCLFTIDGFLTEENQPGSPAASLFTHFSNPLSYASNGLSHADTAFPKHGGGTSDVGGRVAKPSSVKIKYYFL